jgi:hypothetical protein
MVRGIESLIKDQNEIEQRSEQSLTVWQDLVRQPEAYPAEGGAKGNNHCVQDPGTRSKEFETREEKEVRAWWRVLKEIDVRALAVQHALGIHPKKYLVVAQQHRNAAENKKVEIEKRGRK